MSRLCCSLIAVGLAFPVQQASTQDTGEQQIEVYQGLKITGVMMDARGRIFIGPVEIAGQSPDDLFTYWIGRHGDSELFGFDVYSGTWMPGPVTYHRAMLNFQDEPVEGWIRQFAGMPDYRRFFGNDGRLYERYQNLYAGDQVYTYFVDMTTGERSDSQDFVSFLSYNRRWLDVVLEQQRVQAEEITQRSEELGRGYAFWQQNAHIPPPVIRSFNDTLQEIILPESIAEESEPSLLELIEEEIGTGAAAAAEPAS